MNLGRLAAKLLAMVIGAALSLQTSAVANSEDQWLFRSKLGSGDDEPTAIYLSFDYSFVLFRATCDMAKHELVLEYFGADGVLIAPNEQLGITGSRTVMLPTVTEDGVMVGRIRVDANFTQIFKDVDLLEILAPNEMEEPWYVGYSEPLRQIVRLCQVSLSFTPTEQGKSAG